MSGMKTTQHNVLDLNHYRVGSRAQKHGTPKNTGFYKLGMDFLLGIGA